MNETRLLILIGLPASSKSTIAEQLKTEYDANVHSSDALRLELFGSEEVQDKNSEVFEELHRRIKDDLSNGKSVAYDATNLSMKRRRHFLSQISDDIEKIAIVVATPLETCIARDALRERTVGERVIRRMYKSFQFPIEGEGFDDIQIRYGIDDIERYKVLRTEYLYDIALKFEQNNPHHTLTVGKHMLKAVRDYVREGSDIDYTVYMALTFHDIGKIFCASFKNKEGEVTDICHYYQHENISAYETMMLINNTPMTNSNEHLVYICQLVQYHMRLYGANSEKSKGKLKKLLGEDMYRDLEIINKYDKGAK